MTKYLGISFSPLKFSQIVRQLQPVICSNLLKSNCLPVMDEDMFRIGLLFKHLYSWLKCMQARLNASHKCSVATPYWQTLHMTDQAISAMRSDVALLKAQGLVGDPTEEQWSMILTGHPVNRVLAAAGSGKSSTLLLRLLFLVRHLCIEPEQISVFSFTAASCEQLRLSLGQWAAVLGIGTEDIKKIGACITTFHARLRQSTPDGLEPFEWLGQSSRGSNRSTSVESNLNDSQLRLINQAYIFACAHDSDFTAQLAELLEHTLDDSAQHGGWNQESSTLNIKLAVQRDESLRLKIRQTLMQRGLWCDELDTSEAATFTTRHYRVGATAQLPDGRLVFVDQLIMQQNWFPKEDQTHYFSTHEGLNVRIQLISQYCFKPYVFVRSLEQWQQIIQHVQMNQRRPQARQRSKPHTPDEAPYFTLCLDGETGYGTVAMHAYRIGSWMLSLGLDPQVPLRTNRLKPVEGAFLKVLPGFWKAFRTTLSHNQLCLYSDQFRQSASRMQPEPWAQHLMIDEFQDVSPEIINWISALQKQHQSHGASLMVIGDDWQSIYAWRGSSPRILLELEQYAAAPWSEQPVRTITLSENFRSSQAIIDDADKVIRHVQMRSEKEVFSRRPHDDHHPGLQLWDLSEQEARQTFIQGLIQLIDHELQTLDRMHGKDRGTLLLMARKRDVLRKISEQMPRHWQSRVRLHTLHSAKGLQAETALLIDDCIADHSGAIRELIYQHVDDRMRYEQMLVDETHRLAYVGMTRAMHRLIWVMRDKKTHSKGVLRYFIDTQLPVRTIPVLNKTALHRSSLAEMTQD